MMKWKENWKMLKWLKKKKNEEFAPNLPQICPKFTPTKFESTPRKSSLEDKKEAGNIKKEYTFDDFVKYIHTNGNKSISKMVKDLGITTKKCRLFRYKMIKFNMLEKKVGTNTFVVNRKECKKWLQK